MSELLGRWDMTVATPEGGFPSWVELGEGEGRFVGRVGSARPLHKLQVEDGWVTFSLPKQYEGRETDLTFTGHLEGDVLTGETTLDDGKPTTWTAKRAPEMAHRPANPGQPLALIGSDLSNWAPRSPEWVNNWSVADGVLSNSAVGSDLVTVDKFSDFLLECEYSYPQGSNSGIYLRGRYEFQILDDYEGSPNGVGNSGAIYGFLAPAKNAVKPHSEWNKVSIELIGRWITVVLNGETILDKAEIPGITGGALDSDEGAPGPIFLQGDHGPVSFRNLTITPL